MIKTFTLTILLAFVCSVGFTQTKEAIDSLQHQLATAKDDTSRINAPHWRQYIIFLSPPIYKEVTLAQVW